MLQPIFNFFWSIVFAITSTFGVNVGTEQPRYNVVERLGEAIEVRQYPTRIVAETTVDTRNSDNPRGDAFRGFVAGYIFGANKERQKIDMTSPVEVSSSGTQIAMTTPVEVNKSDGVLVMRFFMPAKYTMDKMPEPSDPRVKLIEVPPSMVAALQFSGSTNDAAVAARAAELTKVLQSKKWKIVGPITTLFYNPPWTIPFLRTNELAVPVSK